MLKYLERTTDIVVLFSIFRGYYGENMLLEAMMAGRILLIEDEEKIARVLELELIHEGYEVETANNGRAGLERALAEEWDLILLDLLLPELGGLEVLRGIRQESAAVPILLLTALDSTTDKVTGLDLGANDYVTKPFSYEELSARIRSLIRHHHKPEQQQKATYQTDELKVETKTHTVIRGEKTIELTPREYDLLVYLLQHKGEVISREKILSDVWGFDFMGQTNLVDVYIRYLRQKIDKGWKEKLIQTMRGVGYFIRETPSP